MGKEFVEQLKQIKKSKTNTTRTTPSPTKLQSQIGSRKSSPKKPFVLQNSKLNLTGMMDGVSLASQSNTYTPPQSCVSMRSQANSIFGRQSTMTGFNRSQSTG